MEPKIFPVLYLLRPILKASLLLLPRFLIPQAVGKDGIDYFRIVDSYMKTSAEDVKEKVRAKGLKLEGLQLFLRVQNPTKKNRGQARFRNQALGKQKMSQVSSIVASKLGINEPELFTGHCWRRTAGLGSNTLLF